MDAGAADASAFLVEEEMYLLKAIEESTGNTKVLWIVCSPEEALEAARIINEMKPVTAGMMRFQVFLDSEGNMIDEFLLI